MKPKLVIINQFVGSIIERNFKKSETSLEKLLSKIKNNDNIFPDLKK